MLLLLILLLAFVSLLNLGLGLIVLFGGTKRTLEQVLFFFVTGSVFLWIACITIFLVSTSFETAMVWARFYYASAALIAYTLPLFAMSFIFKRRTVINWALILLIPLGAVFWSIFGQQSLIAGASLKDVGNETILNKQIYNYYVLYFLVHLYGAIALILIQLMRAKNKKLKQQLMYIFVGFISAGTFGVLFNLILPFFDNYKFIWVGPMFSITFIAPVFIAIVRHKLFDVRLVIARSSAYLLLIVTLATLYGLSLFGIAAFLFPDETISTLRGMVIVAFAVVLAFSFHPLKEFFDRVTDKIFFRGEYNTGDVLNKVGNILTEEIDLEKISTRTLRILSKALKSSFIKMVILPTAELKEHSFNVGAKNEVEISQEMLKALTDVDEQVLISDYADYYTDLRNEMRDKKISLILRIETSKELIGYMFYGEKQNGGIYNYKDVKMLSTLGYTIGVAIENSIRFLAIRNFNRTLQKKVSEATTELKHTNARLREIDAAKDDFISMASHQLRTPLTSIKGYLSMVLEGDAGTLKEKQQSLLSEAFTSSQRMVYLISDFLNVSRIQTGKFILELKPVDLANLIKSEIQQHESITRNRGVTIVYQKPDNFPMVMLDQNKMSQVIMNFINNAVTYSKPGGLIKVELTSIGGKACLKVIDNGIGVPSHERHKLFTKFFRATNAKNQRPDGTGIGLFMAKKVVLEHGGEMLFQTKENVGSTFGFCIPIKNSP